MIQKNLNKGGLSLYSLGLQVRAIGIILWSSTASPRDRNS